jgi:hypothetical protein
VPFILLWKGPAGQPLALLNASWRCWPRRSLSNPWSGALLAQAIEWVTGRPLPARALEADNTTLNVVGLQGQDRLLITLISYSSAAQARISLELCPDWADWSFREIRADGQPVELTCKRNEGRPRLVLHGRTSCLGVRFLVGDRNR